MRGRFLVLKGNPATSSSDLRPCNLQPATCNMNLTACNLQSVFGELLNLHKYCFKGRLLAWHWSVCANACDTDGTSVNPSELWSVCEREGVQNCRLQVAGSEITRLDYLTLQPATGGVTIPNTRPPENHSNTISFSTPSSPLANKYGENY